jgi:hypothetical protein
MSFGSKRFIIKSHNDFRPFSISFLSLSTLANQRSLLSGLPNSLLLSGSIQTSFWKHVDLNFAHDFEHLFSSCCWSLGFWHLADMHVDADVSEKCFVSILRSWSGRTLAHDNNRCKSLKSHQLVSCAWSFLVLTFLHGFGWVYSTIEHKQMHLYIS